MTDPIECPECHGSGEECIGTLTLQCRFCDGAGQVGGEYEPAEGGHQRADGFRTPVEGEEYDLDVHGPLPAVWTHPAAEGAPCPQCLGTGKVIKLGDMLRGDVHRKVIEMPCPACAPS